MEATDLPCSPRGRGMPSLGLMARRGVPAGGRVRMSRAVEDQSAPIPRERTSRLGGSIYLAGSTQSEASLIVRHGITIARCS
jgi:hypothetical protein